MTATQILRNSGFSWHFYCDSCWIRFRGWLLHWKRSSPLFSERYGYTKFYRIPFTTWRVRLERGAGSQMNDETIDKLARGLAIFGIICAIGAALGFVVLIVSLLSRTL